MRRSLLFMPGNNAGMLLNADALGADGIILDLEDAVSPQEKDAARILVRNALHYLDYQNTEVVIRINSLDNAFWEDDLKAVLPAKPDAILVPKVNTAEDIHRVAEFMTEIESESEDEKPCRIIPLLETALGIENAYQIAAADPRVTAIFLGAEDLTADLGCQRTREGSEILYSRGRVVVAARAAEVDCYDTPFTDVDDEAGLLDDVRLAKSLGFSGKAAISPRHVLRINEIFSPSAEEIAYAQEVMDTIRVAEEQGKGAVSLHGKMIDAPIVSRARQTLEMAQALGGYDYE